MNKFLGIDYGLERTGLAVGFADSGVILPLSTLKLKDFGNRKKLLDNLAALALREQIENAVLGLPLNLDGSENKMSAIVRNVAPRLKRRLNVPLYFMPEFLSSEEARADLLNAGLSGRKLKEALDQQAACRILSSFLAQERGRWILA